MNFKLSKLFAILLVSGTMFLGFLPQAQALQISDYPSFLNLRAGMTLMELVSAIFGFLLIIAGLATFVMIVWGGISYLTSAGDPSKTSDAKSQIFSAVLGLIIILASWMILNTINPQLVELREPGVPESPEAGELEGLMGACVEGESATVELFSKKNYNAESRFACFDPGESQSSGIARDINSVQVNGGAVRFYEDENYGGRSICFTSSYPDLGECGIVCGFWGCNEWQDDVSSLRVGTCQYPGITVDENGVPTDHRSERCSGF
jgi:hypothetical protein